MEEGFFLASSKVALMVCSHDDASNCINSNADEV